MIIQEKVLAQLHDKREQFLDFAATFRDEARAYADAVEQLKALSADELRDQLAGQETPGALPTSEFDRAPHLCLGFPERFDNHQEARAWAHDALLDHTTCAADGSQIPATREFNIPVAALQVAWFVNPHTRAADYIKDAAFELLAPAELVVEYEGDRLISEQQVNTRRFELEVEALCRLIERIGAEHKATTKLPVAFFDSSLVISFAERLQEGMKRRHIEAMLRLLRCAETAGVPLIGYVDRSDARDLTRMLEHAFGLPRAARIFDAQLIGPLLAWGDRTPLFVCARPGADQKRESILALLAADGHRLGFTYLRTAASAPPARLDIPLWVYERGLLDEVIDLVRAEVIVGSGYPYALEAADAATVITARDREAFLVITQKFLREQGIDFQVSQKRTSKERRR